MPQRPCRQSSRTCCSELPFVAIPSPLSGALKQSPASAGISPHFAADKPDPVVLGNTPIQCCKLVSPHQMHENSFTWGLKPRLPSEKPCLRAHKVRLPPMGGKVVAGRPRRMGRSGVRAELPRQSQLSWHLGSQSSITSSDYTNTGLLWNYF